MKKCNKCSEEKNILDFDSDRTKKDGKSTVCRTCRAVSNLEWRKKNKAYISRKNKEWRDKSVEHLIEYRKKKNLVMYLIIMLVESMKHLVKIKTLQMLHQKVLKEIKVYFLELESLNHGLLYLAMNQNMVMVKELMMLFLLDFIVIHYMILVY